MSLPYGLKVLFNKKYQGTLFGQLCGKYNYAEIAFEFGSDRKDLDSCFPILHPLSDLTKEIEHNGEKFVPIDIINKSHKLLGLSEYRLFEKENKSCALLFSSKVEGFNIFSALDDMIKLIEWHFDIADLIEKNEAIDINTIENQYK